MKIAVESASTTFGFNNEESLVFGVLLAGRASFLSAYDVNIQSNWISVSNNTLKKYYTLDGAFSFADASSLSGASGEVSSFRYLEYLGADRGYDKVTFSDTTIGLQALLFGSDWSALLKGDDDISGGSNSDFLLGYAGNDTLTGNGGNDRIEGGEGSDTAAYMGALVNYRLTELDGVLTVEDLVGTEGSDTLLNIESLQFADKVVLSAGLNKSERLESNLLSIVVESGVLGSAPVLLTNLNESVVYIGNAIAEHTVSYQGIDYNYESVDALFSTVSRNDEFTEEFRIEIADYAPSVANITYQEAVTLVGVANLDAVMLTVAGADGNYIG